MEKNQEIKNKEAEIWNILKFVMDPEVEVNIVDLGLIYKVEFYGEGNVDILMTLSTPACPIGDAIVNNVVEAIKVKHPEYEVDVQLTFDPPWSAEMISEEGKMLLGM
jgi:metal-sulfur cluster biosynthetic enzyme